MSTVFENLTERATGMCRRDDFFGQPLRVTLSDDATGQIRDYTPERNEQFALTGAVTVMYWANKAQRSDARRIAEKTLAQLLYSDVLRQVAMARQAVSDGDRSRAMAVLGDLEHLCVHGSLR